MAHLVRGHQPGAGGGVMRTRWGRPVHDPQTWIQIATSGLCDEARRAIDREVMDHYKQALEEALARDIPPLLAIEEALQSLGDPVSAGKGFQRVHLTRLELRWMSPTINPGLAGLGVILVTAIWILWFVYDGGWLFASLPLYTTYLMAHIFIRGRRPMPLVVAFHSVFLAAMVSTGPDGLMAFAWLCMILPDTAMDLHMQRKLRRVSSH